MRLKLVAGILLSLLVITVAGYKMSEPKGYPESGVFDFPTQKLPQEAQLALWEHLKKKNAISWSAADFLGHNDNFVLHNGDLVIDDDFALWGGKSLIVEGDLIIDGTYGDNGTGHLVVIGDMTADNVLTVGTSIVTGKLTVDELVYCYYNDHISEFRGGVNARAFFVYDKDCSFSRDDSTIKFYADDYQYDEINLDLYRHLRPEVAAIGIAEANTVPDYGASSDLIRGGESIFRATPAPEAFTDTRQRFLNELDGYEEFSASDLMELADIDETFRIVIAGRENLNADIQAHLIESGDVSVLKALARNPSTTAVHLAQIFDLPPAARPIMAGNPNTPAPLVAELAADPDPEVRAVIARRRDINAIIAETLSKDADPHIRLQVASYAAAHHLSEASRIALANDTSPDVAIRLIDSDVLLPTKTYVALANHANPEIRYAIAEALLRQALWQNRRTLSDEDRHRIAEGLFEDRNKPIYTKVVGALTAERQREIGTDWLSKGVDETGKPYWFTGLAEVTTSPALMLEFAKSDDLRIRESLAENLALTPDAQHHLIDPLDAIIAEGTEIPEELDEIISELMQNDNFADDVLLRVAKLIEKTGTDTRFSTTILHHNNLPADVLTLLFGLELGDEYRERVALDIIHSPRATRALIGPALRLWYKEDEPGLNLWFLGAKPSVLREHRSFKNLSDKDYWEALANAKDERLREIAANNIATPTELIVKLAADEERGMRRVALSNPNMPIDHPLLLAADVSELSNPGLSDEALFAFADRYQKEGRDYDARDLFEDMSRRKLRAKPK